MKNQVFNGRLYYLIALPIVICIGLLSRRLHEYIPDIVDIFLGDSLWAIMIYLLARIIFANRSKRKAAYIGLLFCFAIELTQLYHADWIDSIRSTVLGGLILGYGFLWSDLFAYALGICIVYFIDEKLPSMIHVNN
jgi:hypothetical protein